MNNFLCQEMEAGPSFEDSIHYKRALEKMDRIYDNNKKLTEYISSDSDSEARE